MYTATIKLKYLKQAHKKRKYRQYAKYCKSTSIGKLAMKLPLFMKYTRVVWSPQRWTLI